MGYASRRFRFLFVFLVSAVLSACANLQGVRDFASKSAELAAYKDVTLKAMDSPRQVAKEIPETAAFANDRQVFQANAQELAAARDSIFKIHDVVAGYMASMAQLAGEDSYDISSGIDTVSGSLKAAGSLGIDASTVDAYSRIASAVTSWILAARQSRDVKGFVGKYGDSMDEMLRGMGLIAVAMRTRLDSDRGRLEAYRDHYVAGSAGEGVKILVRHSFEDIIAHHRNAVSSADAAIQGIKVVRANHDQMRKNVDKIDSKEMQALLKKAAGDLREVFGNLKKI